MASYDFQKVSEENLRDLQGVDAKLLMGFPRSIPVRIAGPANLYFALQGFYPAAGETFVYAQGLCWVPLAPQVLPEVLGAPWLFLGF